MSDYHDVKAPGRKYRMAFTGLLCLAVLTLAATIGLVAIGEAELASKCAQAGMAAIGTTISIYLGGQAYVDRHRGDTG